MRIHEKINGIIDNMDKLKQLRKEADAKYDDIEYALLLQAVYDQALEEGELDRKKPVKFRFNHTFPSELGINWRHGGLVFFQDGGKRVHYPVRYKEWMGDVINIWGNPALHERLTYWILVRAFKRPPNVVKVEKARQNRLDHGTEEQPRHPLPAPPVEYVVEEAPTDEARA